MTHAENILNYLWSIAPDGATNGELARELGIASQQTVYMTTQDLQRRGLLRAEQRGRTWVFSAVEAEPGSLALGRLPAGARAAAGDTLSPQEFEALSRRVLGDHFGVELSPGSVPRVRKRFDFVSPDGQIVGDAKYYARVGGLRLPAAKFSGIAEHVWLLEKTGAPVTFLVFGNDREVPLLWLDRYGNLAPEVSFYFLADDGHLELLAGPDDPLVEPGDGPD